MLSGCLRRPQSFLERIAFAETALWGDACAAPDSGVTLFIAQLPEHVVTLEAGASSQHLAPGSLPLLSLQSRPKAEIHSLSCVALFDTEGSCLSLLPALRSPSVKCGWSF